VSVLDGPWRSQQRRRLSSIANCIKRSALSVHMVNLIDELRQQLFLPVAARAQTSMEHARQGLDERWLRSGWHAAISSFAVTVRLDDLVLTSKGHAVPGMVMRFPDRAYTHYDCLSGYSELLPTDAEQCVKASIDRMGVTLRPLLRGPHGHWMNPALYGDVAAVVFRGGAHSPESDPRIHPLPDAGLRLSADASLPASFTMLLADPTRE